MRKIFAWNFRNVTRLGKHGVSTEEARYIVEHASGRYPKKIGDRKFLVRGRTATHRALQVIFIVLNDAKLDVEQLDLIERLMLEQGNEVSYVIHARDLSTTEKRRI